jgi:hypothetical protein
MYIFGHVFVFIEQYRTLLHFSLRLIQNDFTYILIKNLKNIYFIEIYGTKYCEKTPSRHNLFKKNLEKQTKKGTQLYKPFMVPSPAKITLSIFIFFFKPIF